MATQQLNKPLDKSNRRAIADAAALVAGQLEPERKTGLRDASGKTMQERHAQRRDWYISEASRQAANRAIMAKCESFYDSEQISHEDAQTLRDRGQNPVVYNEIFYVINWLIGTERRNRVDFNVVAEGDEDEDSDDAITKTKLLKYLDDVNGAAFERSYAAEECFKAGLGWLEVGLRGDKSGSPIYVGAESWRNILWDSHATKRDLSDARYFFRIKTVDLDVAIALFPDKEAELRRVVEEGDQMGGMFGGAFTGKNGTSGGLDNFDRMDGADDLNSVSVIDLFNPRERVTLLECWSREPVRRKIGEEGLGDPVTFKMRVTIMTELDTLLEAWSPFKHNDAPFIPLWAYRNSRTRLPYSPTRPLLGPQEALNHRMSKSLYEASANKMEIEVGAIDDEVMDVDELREQWNSPDGTAIYANGALTGGKVRQMQNDGAASQQLVLAERDISTIRHMSGIDAAAQGLKSQLTSGVALKTNNDNVGLLTMELFDNLLRARQSEGEMTLSLAEQFIVQPMTIRVAGEGNSRGERVRINEPQADGTYANDITARRAHFVVGEQAWKQSYAESAFESLMLVFTQLAPAAPQVVVNLLDVLFEMHPNLPRKKAILERIRSVNGQSDPDGKMTPEQQQAQAEKQAMAKKQFELSMAELQAKVEKLQAEGKKINATALREQVTALYEAAQGAAVLVQSPMIAPAADQILASAGFVDQGGAAQTLGAVQADPAMAQQPQPGQMAQPAPETPPELMQADGAAAGIETPAQDGAPLPQGEF